jgi:hypothetical protein
VAAACLVSAQEPAEEPPVSNETDRLLEVFPTPAPSKLDLKAIGTTNSGLKYERWNGLPGCRVAGARTTVLGGTKAPDMSQCL